MNLSESDIDVCFISNFAALSANSLPSMSSCSGIQCIWGVKPALIRVWRLYWHCKARCCSGSGLDFWILYIAAWLSEKIQVSLVLWRFSFNVHLKACAIANNSAS